MPTLERDQQRERNLAERECPRLKDRDLQQIAIPREELSPEAAAFGELRCERRGQDDERIQHDHPQHAKHSLDSRPLDHGVAELTKPLALKRSENGRLREQNCLVSLGRSIEGAVAHE